MSAKETDTKQRIIDVSLDLFANKGFSGASIRDIAEAANTTLPNIYYYFGSKEGLYSYILRDIMTRFAASVSGAAGGPNIREQLVNMGKAKHHFMAQNLNIMRLLFRERIGSESGFKFTEEIGSILTGSITMMAEMVRHGITIGEFRQIDPELAARFLLGVFNNYDMELASLGRVPSDEEIEAVVDLALEAIKKR